MLYLLLYYIVLHNKFACLFILFVDNGMYSVYVVKNRVE